MTIFKSKTITDKNGFRIPAITSTSQGNIVAVADIRYDNTDMPGKVEFLIKTSNDGGNTWETSKFTSPKGGITDPSIVHDKTTGKTFLFGYQNNKGITDPNGNFDFFVYSSNDGGKTWDNGVSIKNQTLPKGYKYILQGPGNGMTYNGNIYIPIQAWHNTENPVNSGKNPGTSGFMYSEDNGKTWKVSGLLAEQGIDVTSESSVFHHNGKIYLAAKAEVGHNEATAGTEKRRVVYATSDNGKTWEKVEENFIPKDAAMCETSTLALNDSVYIVGFAIQDKIQGGYNREDLYITTNTGKSLKIFEGKTLGYTSLAMDEDNLYILYEGKKEDSDIDMRRFDISAKEYANINAQILNRGTDLLDVQDKLFASRSYLTGEYASQDNSGVEAVILNGNYKIGAFHKNSKENSKDVYRTIEYNTEDTTLVLSQDNVITNNDNIFAGYQYTKLSYLNGSKNDINSFVIGYSLNHKFENDFGYNLGINGIYSNNKLDRNEAEGLGKSASFDSYSISLKNEIYRDIKVQENTNLNLATGLRTTYFGHDDIKEKNGNGFNDAYVDRLYKFSNEIYLKVSAEHDIRFNEKFAAKIGANVGYNKELMNVDDWRDKFTILDVEKEYARPIEKHSAGVANAGFHLTLDFADKVETTLAYTVDSTGEGITTGRLTYKF
ncbi:exo-alpha-sialidase [Fusobacterium mortiferum]|uniref:exo-alpha-sialidase n=1 Tax=Fusobacterium mortiferum TaxID=850 RepID=UPI001F2853AF|nr:exo-alpha-sialidase [Fusobacterium mortiferum]MCF2699475.1 exo-alpha-sialidase [Fusobacterium mortiferum]